MRVIDDGYGFDAALADRLESIHQDQARLQALAPPYNAVQAVQELRRASQSNGASNEKVEKTTMQLELKKSIADNKPR
jgi:hypothetical protein